MSIINKILKEAESTSDSEIKGFIKKTLVDFYKQCKTDQYGQVHINNFQDGFFGSRDKEVQDYCKENKGILQYSTYGGSYGTYNAFTIEDKGISKACSEALRKNPNYLSSINQW